ncbi:23S rRNA (pseudouridine(1915)-N(3))-methyltransferase RlmH [Elongatibacter sediminis]|uniref:Ribosomal RNA large subunit methyltransferase H n=1 Tax=Elongatibacter sediminis TaxID=3119006 RepID=A0AAW9RHX5_9GAMM
MRLRVVAIGQRMPAWVQQGWKEYAGRMPRNLPLELREIPAGRRTRQADVGAIRERECAALIDAAAAPGPVVVLDETGLQWTTADLSRQLADWMQFGDDIHFLIGGPDGLNQETRDRADRVWSLGKLTLPHPMVRLILAEQIYRAWTILQNHPYHRA